MSTNRCGVPGGRTCGGAGVGGGGAGAASAGRTISQGTSGRAACTRRASFSPRHPRPRCAPGCAPRNHCSASRACGCAVPRTARARPRETRAPRAESPQGAAPRAPPAGGSPSSALGEPGAGGAHRRDARQGREPVHGTAASPGDLATKAGRGTVDPRRDRPRRIDGYAIRACTPK